jgi:nitroreductase
MDIVNHTDHAVLPAVARRWSPHRFLDRAVAEDTLLRCLEAARWASSSYNDQPWFWIVSQKTDKSFPRMLRCLLEPNRTWATSSPVLMLSVLRTNLHHNGQPNPVALHDLGQASAYLSLQACDVGLQVHQMGGINRSATRLAFQIPDGFEPCTITAIGYPDVSELKALSGDEYGRRQIASRRRKDLHTCVFTNQWGEPATFLPDRTNPDAPKINTPSTHQR